MRMRMRMRLGWDDAVRRRVAASLTHKGSPVPRQTMSSECAFVCTLQHRRAGGTALGLREPNVRVAATGEPILGFDHFACRPAASPGRTKEGPCEQGPPNVPECSELIDRQAAAASNCQFFGMITASMTWMTPFVATISACLTPAPLTSTPDDDLETMSVLP